MLFNSIEFLIFACFFFILFFILRGRLRLAWCVLASYFFYAWWDWRFVGLIFGSTLVTFYSGRMIGKSNLIQKKKIGLWFCIISHLGVLGFFKYFSFCASIFKTIFHWIGLNVTYETPNILLPVGISFFTFTGLSYVIDVYRGKIGQAENDFLVFSAYRALFPQLVAGPILRASQILPELKIDPAFDWARVGRGFEKIAWGYLLKLCLADNAAMFANPRFENPELFTSFSLLLAVIVFAFQIYGDFAGYSLIAIGLAQIMGYEFPNNFDKPYFASSISDFWLRWHITLGKWFRDYVFLPIAYSLSRRLKEERYFGLKTEQWLYAISIILTMMLVGLWHGASWTFIFWGFLHGTYLAGQRMLAKPFRAVRKIIRCPTLISNSFSMLSVFLLICISWIFFHAKTFKSALYILRSIVSWGATAHLSFGGMKYLLVRILFIACIVLAVDFLSTRGRVRSIYKEYVLVRLFLAGISVIIILFTGNFASNSFIYFQF